MSLRDQYIEQGAVLAPDGIPLHFGDLKAEYHAALDGTILLDRSHEARLQLTGQDRFELLNRMSTNQVIGLQHGRGAPTILTNANARILDRIEVFNMADDSLLVLGGPGRSDALVNYLQRNIFFNDRVALENRTTSTVCFALHGTSVDDVIHGLIPETRHLGIYSGIQAQVAGQDVVVACRKPFVGFHWLVVVSVEGAAIVWNALLDAGKGQGLLPSGGLVYNVLRIRAGVPGVGRELSDEFIPLELGLWDEVSFSKGCYTGQEIIARMESRNRLARTIVRLELDVFVDAPADLYSDGKRIGQITSSVISPDDEIFAIGVVKTSVAHAAQELFARKPDGTRVLVQERLGVQPAHLFE